MSLQINIPDSVLAAIRLPQARVEQELLKELAVALYSQEMLPFNQAQELAQMDGCSFGILLRERCVNRHCNLTALNDEIFYACSE